MLLCGILIFGAGCKTTTNNQASTAPSASFGENAGDEAWEEFEDEVAYTRHYDPFEGFNRAIFSFNDGLYDYVLGPVADGYKWVVPNGVRNGISNFFDNIRYPIRFVNQILQGKFAEGMKETGMFLVNTTYGVVGIFDRADEFPGLDVPPEDLGQTFGVWGIGNGPYIVIPVLGPSTARDIFGRAGDRFADPGSYLGYWQWEAAWSARGVDNLNALPGRVEVYEAITGSALDKYTAVKDGYLQLRKKQVEE